MLLFSDDYYIPLLPIALTWFKGSKAIMYVLRYAARSDFDVNL